MRGTAHNLRFCPHCAGNLLSKPEESGFECQSCRKVIYLNSKPSVAGVCVEEGRVLLVTASRPPKLVWDLPGGFLLYGEEPVDGLRRELREELGVEVAVCGLLTALVDSYGRDGERTLNLFYEVHVERGEPRPGAEITQARWFDRCRLPRIKYPTSRVVISSLESLRNRGSLNG